MWKSAKYASICSLLSACAAPLGDLDLKPTPIVRGVDSGTRQVVDDYYSVRPDCGNLGYPEVNVLKTPGHGTAAVEKGEVYPNFSKDNVRYECNKNKVASTQVFYESYAGFHGRDSFTVQVRFVNSSLRLITYNIDVL
jgi:hypothetical protein